MREYESQASRWMVATILGILVFELLQIFLVILFWGDQIQEWSQVHRLLVFIVLLTWVPFVFTLSNRGMRAWWKRNT